MKPRSELFVLELKGSGERVRVFAFAPFVRGGEPMGGSFLVHGEKGWAFRPVEDFVPCEVQDA